MKISILLLMLAMVSLYACERSYERIIKGVITHKATGKPMEDVKVLLQDGLATNDPILGSDNTAPKNFDSTVTDVSGRYEVKVETKSSHGFIYIYKDGYLHAAESVQMVAFKGKSNTQEINMEMNGRAYYNTYFIKNSAPYENTDLLMFYFLGYSNLNEEYGLGPYEFEGKGPFLLKELNSISFHEAIGDRYLRYKLKYNTNGTWQTKIDSVFLPTSMEVFTDTIYY